MDYVLGRTNANGMVVGMTGDWVFVDWADGYLDKKGELSFRKTSFILQESGNNGVLCRNWSADTAMAKQSTRNWLLL